MDLKAKQDYFGAYSLRGLKVFDTDDGYAYSATILENGQPIGQVHQGGYGGPTDVRIADTSALSRLKAFCASKPPIVSHGYTLTVDTEIFLDELQAHTETLKSLRRKAKGRTLVSLKCDPEDTYRIISLEFSPALKERIEAKYGPELRCVMNEFL